MKNTDNKWNKLYSQYIQSNYNNWQEYFYEKMKLKRNFFNLVIKYSLNNKPIIECGSGTGKFSVYLASFGLNIYAMDLESEMVKQTKQLAKTIGTTNPVKVFKGDISSIPFKDNFFSVSHSSGVLEHFSDRKIVQLINEQIRVADTIIFSVPSQYFEKKMLGDERFLSRKKWRKIISKSKAKIIKETGYHYKPLIKRIIDIFQKPSRIFKPIALYVFVLQKK
ncbi:MAG TPA: class I SAM-dependent methyltransferase [Candidatus Woesebacteria bacterium]|nr:class I SAM-dependent methyltransferase [Candidatus Woesebacteria bacterium]